MHSKIVEALNALNIELAFLEYDGNAKEYIVFDIYNEKDSDFADDENLTETYDIQITYWFKSISNINKYKEIIEIIKNNGFIFKKAKDLKDGHYFGKNMDFIYVKNTKDGE